nr:adult cement protein 8 [Chelonibia testudinaria]
MAPRLLLGWLLLATAATAAPTGDSGSGDVVTRVLRALQDNVNDTSSGGQHVLKTRSAQQTKVTAPGGSASKAAVTAGASTPFGQETSVSTALASGQAEPGSGLSATGTIVDGKAGTENGKAGSGATAIVGSIAVEDGKISTSTAIVGTKGNTDKGSKTDALGLTSSFGSDGEAKGAQYTSSEAGASNKATTQGEISIGSSVGNIGTLVTVGGGTQTTRKSPKQPKQLSVIDQTKRLLAIDQKLRPKQPVQNPVPVTYPSHYPNPSPYPPSHKPSPYPPSHKPSPYPPSHKPSPYPPSHKPSPYPPSQKPYPSQNPPPPHYVKQPVGGGGTIQVNSLDKKQATLPGGSSSQSALQSSSSTPGGAKTSTSTVVSEALAEPGEGGLSATATLADGGGKLGHDRAGSDATLLTGSIAVNDGQISTSTGIVKAVGDTKGGTQTDALGLTTSFGKDGEARGAQHSAAQTKASKKSVSQADVTVGSQVGKVGTKITVAGESKVENKPTTPVPAPVVVF